MSRQGEAQARTTENVKDFWNKEADDWGDNPQVTIRDHYFRLLKLGVICELIRGRRKLLDIGCGTGFSTLFYSQVVDQAVGADYAGRMVVWAQRFLDDATYFERTMREFAVEGAPKLTGNVRFEEGNVLALGYPDASFDAVVAERVLINLPEPRLQDDAMAEVARVLAPNGIWASVEVTEQGHATVDRLRFKSFGLSIIEKYWHNLYVDEDRYVEVGRARGLRIKRIHHFETFQFLTKVVHPLIVAPAEPKFLAKLNDAARRVSAQFPTYETVQAVGLKTFLRQKFRPLLEQYDADKLAGFDALLGQIVAAKPDFRGCSHQVLFHFEKRA